MNGAADLSNRTPYDFNRPAWAMAIDNTKFLCSINYDQSGDPNNRQVRVLAVGI